MPKAGNLSCLVPLRSCSRSQSFCYFDKCHSTAEIYWTAGNADAKKIAACKCNVGKLYSRFQTWGFGRHICIGPNPHLMGVARLATFCPRWRQCSCCSGSASKVMINLCGQVLLLPPTEKVAPSIGLFAATICRSCMSCRSGRRSLLPVIKGAFGPTCSRQLATGNRQLALRPTAKHRLEFHLITLSVEYL